MPLPAAALVPVQGPQGSQWAGGAGGVSAAGLAERSYAGAAVLVRAVPADERQHAVALGDALHQRGRPRLVRDGGPDAVLVLLPAVPPQGTTHTHTHTHTLTERPRVEPQRTFITLSYRFCRTLGLSELRGYVEC